MSVSFMIGILPRAGLRTTQFSILARLRRHGAMTINALAEDMVMDRTTLGRNILPLERDGLITIKPGRTDRRSKELRLTDAGLERLRAGYPRLEGCAEGVCERLRRGANAWACARLLHEVSTTDLPREAAAAG